MGLRSLWRPVVPATVRPATPSQSSETQFPWRVCDGPSYPRRSVLPFRYKVQRVAFSTQISEFLSVLKRDSLDGPSCPWRSVVGSIVPASFSRIKVCCSKWLNRSLQIGHIARDCKLPKNLKRKQIAEIVIDDDEYISLNFVHIWFS